MNLDFDYLAGRDLHCPVRPIKPRIYRWATAAGAREYADALEYYEKAMEEYKVDRDRYTQQINNRLLELKCHLRNEYDITEGQMHLLWGKAYEDGHSEGLHRVVEDFKELYELAAQFAELEK